MNNNSRPENHLRSLSATFAAFHISTRTALRHRPHYIVPLLSEGVHRVEYFLFGQVQLQHRLSWPKKKTEGGKLQQQNAAHFQNDKKKRSLSLPDAVVALCVYIKTNRRRMQNASKEMFCVQYRGPHRGRCDGTFCSRCWFHYTGKCVFPKAEQGIILCRAALFRAFFGKSKCPNDKYMNCQAHDECWVEHLNFN